MDWLFSKLSKQKLIWNPIVADASNLTPLKRNPIFQNISVLSHWLHSSISPSLTWILQFQIFYASIVDESAQAALSDNDAGHPPPPHRFTCIQ